MSFFFVSSFEPCVAPQGNICCWSTGKLYTQAMLGVGIRREKKNLGTAAELLSKEAFDGGLRQNTDPWLVNYLLVTCLVESC